MWNRGPTWSQETTLFWQIALGEFVCTCHLLVHLCWAWQDAPEVMFMTQSVMICWLYWCDSEKWRYLLKNLLIWLCQVRTFTVTSDSPGPSDWFEINDKKLSNNLVAIPCTGKIAETPFLQNFDKFTILANADNCAVCQVSWVQSKTGNRYDISQQIQGIFKKLCLYIPSALILSFSLLFQKEQFCLFCLSSSLLVSK